MTQETVSVVAKFYVRPTKHEAFLKAAQPMIDGTRKESGCIFYNLHQDIENPNIYFMLEEWTSLDKLKAHGESAHVLKNRATAKEQDLIEKPTEVYKLHQVKGTSQ